MRPLGLLHKVGPPTWKRSGPLVFSAVMGVLLIGGTAMAANLGLLAFNEPGDRGHRLEVPRPPLSVTVPTSEPAPPTVHSTSATDDVEDTDDDVDDNEVDDNETDDSPAAEDSMTENPDSDDTESTSGRDHDGDDDGDDDADDDDVDDDDDAGDEIDDNDRQRGESGEPGGKTGTSATNGDGSLDDD